MMPYLQVRGVTHAFKTATHQALREGDMLLVMGLALITVKPELWMVLREVKVYTDPYVAATRLTLYATDVEISDKDLVEKTTHMAGLKKC